MTPVPDSGREQIIVVGGGGHGAVCVDVLLAVGFDVAGVVDVRAPDRPLPVEYLGDDDWLDDLLDQGQTLNVFVGLGDNRRRRDMQTRLEAKGARIPAAVSPHAYVSPTATVGAGALVVHGAVINPRSVVGRGVIVNTGASVDHDCALGDFTHIAPGVHLAGSVIVGPGSFVGVGAVVIPDTPIGSWATVGAGAAVIEPVEDATTVAGVPARPR